MKIHPKYRKAKGELERIEKLLHEIGRTVEDIQRDIMTDTYYAKSVELASIFKGQLTMAVYIRHALANQLKEDCEHEAKVTFAFEQAKRLEDKKR